MKVAVGIRELEFGSEIIDLRDSNDIISDREALHQRFADEGYLLIRGMHPRETVLNARRAVFEYMAANSEAIMPGTDPIDAVINPGKQPPRIMGNREVTHHPDVLKVLEGEPAFNFFSNYFGERSLTFDYKWLRPVGKEAFTGAHFDNIYMGRGSKKLMTCWTPLGDTPMEMGTLAICLGSHSLPGFQKLRDTYGQVDVDRDRIGGWFTQDPLEVTEKFGGQWASTNFQAGDVIIIGMFTLHGSTKNVTDRWRLSCDTRFQPASEPADERWIGESPKAHYAWTSEPEKVKTMAQARAEWGV